MEETEAALPFATKAYNNASYTSIAGLAMDESEWHVLMPMRAELTFHVAAFWLVNPCENAD